MSTAFERAKKTFLGFLQARGKSLNTIKNYSCDLHTFGQFCETHQMDFQSLGISQLDSYHKTLMEQGLQTNSRRRKLITAKTFLRYLSGRMEVSTVGSEKLIPPEKVELPPKIPSREKINEIIQAQSRLDQKFGIGWRNQALIGILLETGMLVTEAVSLYQKDCTWNNTGALLQITGRRSRTVHVSIETANALRKLSEHLVGMKYFFYGYSRSGPNAERLTPRGVELLFKAWSKTFGIEHLHPRTMRHLFIIDWLNQGKTEKEIMTYLGLKTAYIFPIYKPLLSSTIDSAKSITSIL
ncbi:MAG: tyrosine-type recombinase/integrase [Oligoflexales bacterium]|nr:tyrosine-type recombinase/integrase [Oligoflexales bacterium]